MGFQPQKVRFKKESPLEKNNKFTLEEILDKFDEEDLEEGINNLKKLKDKFIKRCRF